MENDKIKDKKMQFYGALTGLFLIVLLYGMLKEQMLTVAAGAGAALAALYLFLDKLMVEKMAAEEKQAELLERIANLSEGIMAGTERQGRELVEKMTEVSEELMENQKKSAKLIVKYNREDLKKIAALHRADSEKTTNAILQNTENLKAAIHDQAVELQPVIDSINHNFTKLSEENGEAGQGNEKEISHLADILADLREDLSKGIKIAEMLPALFAELKEQQQKYQEPVKEEAAATEELEEEVMPDAQGVVKNEDMFSIGNLVSETKGVPPEIMEKAAHPVKEETPKEPAVTEEAKVPEEPVAAEETEVTEAPAMPVISSDPGKQLSAEEIQALFSSMGQ